MSAHQMPCRVKRNMYHSHVIRRRNKKCTSQENNTDAVRVLSVMSAYASNCGRQRLLLGVPIGKSKVVNWSPPRSNGTSGMTVEKPLVHFQRSMVFASYLPHFSFESVILGSLVVWSGRPVRLLSALVFGRMGCWVGPGSCLMDDSVLCVVRSSLV